MIPRSRQLVVVFDPTRQDRIRSIPLSDVSYPGRTFSQFNFADDKAQERFYNNLLRNPMSTVDMTPTLDITSKVDIRAVITTARVGRGQETGPSRRD